MREILVQFGNYILSEDRKNRVLPENRNGIWNSDIENFIENNPDYKTVLLNKFKPLELPSTHQLSDNVILNFFTEENSDPCKVEAVVFMEGKVLYAVDTPVEPNEYTRNVTLIDSVSVEAISSEVE